MSPELSIFFFKRKSIPNILKQSRSRYLSITKAGQKDASTFKTKFYTPKPISWFCFVKAQTKAQESYDETPSSIGLARSSRYKLDQVFFLITITR